MKQNLLEFIDREVSSQLNIKKEIQNIDPPSMDHLLEFIDKEIANLSLLSEDAKELTIESAWESIPMPELSELGWADPSKKKGELTDKSRSEMTSFLSQVQASTLEEQIIKLQNLLDTAGEEQKSIPEILSFLIFYKTLTYIIGDFNPSTAGFLFESLLGVLTGGKQIAAKGAGGGDTIADFVYQRGVKSQGGAQYVSLKLLTEKGTGIGGSFTDLIDDLIDKNAMQYVVVLKSLSGSKESLSGALSFYEFTFNRQDFVKQLSKSTLGQEALTLAEGASRAMLDEPLGDFQHKERWNEWVKTFLPSLIGAGMPKPSKRGEEEYAHRLAKGRSPLHKWEDVLALEVDKLTSMGEPVEEIFNPKNYIHAINPSTGEEEEWYGNKEDPFYFTYRWLRKQWDEHNRERQSEKEIKDDRVSQLGNIPQKKTKSKKKKKQHNWMSSEDSLLELLLLSKDTNIKDKDFWEFIKRYSYGSLSSGKFEITQGHLRDIANPFATLKVGRKVVAGALNKMITEVNQKMFEIYSNLNKLKIHLRGFFMNEMNVDEGEKATDAAEMVRDGTEILVNKQKGGS